MKKELIVFMVIVSTAVILSASGKQDNVEDQTFVQGNQGQRMMNHSADYSEDRSSTREGRREDRQADRDEYLESLELVTVSGELSLVNGELPYIDMDGVKYSFMAPWQQVQDLELVNGMDVSVEGYEMPSRPLMWDGSEKSIMVTKAVINGEEIVIDHDSRMGGHGRHDRNNNRDGRGSRQGNN